MSVPEFQIEFSILAQKDISDILTYTLDSWGDDQFVSYQALLDKAFAILIHNPHIGRADDRLRTYSVGSHRIFYRTAGQTIYVMRVLHEKMNPDRYLQNLQ